MDSSQEYAYACENDGSSQSDSESVSGTSSLSEDFVENEDGGQELILVARCEGPKASKTHGVVTGENLGGLGYSQLFQSCVSHLKTEKIIQCSPRGKKTLDLLQYLEQAEHGQLVDISIHLIDKINSCITVSHNRMPSSAQGSMWSAFHQLRSGSEIQRVWCRYVARSIPPHVNCEESQLVLQLLLDRILKKLLENKAKASKKYEISDDVRPLTSLECNAVRYMAGYVAIKLLKKYQKPTKHQELKTKHQYFIKVLHQMQATDQPGDVDTLSDYTRLWSELIDRGGLYHISGEVFRLLEAIELIVRRYLSVQSIEVDNTDLKKQISDAVTSSDAVQKSWKAIAGCIPKKFEQYSVCLLQAITELWINVRGHSFAQGWTMMFETKYKRGIRKSLQTPREK